jgi:glycosyltransferase involved in cell wall biosynthesis
MKILFLSDDFPPKSFGGAGIITADLAVGIRDAGHEVYVITTVQNKNHNPGWRDYSGVKVYDLYVDYYQKLSTYISLYNPRAFITVEQLIREIRPDVIHAHNIHNYLSYYCLKISKKYTDKLFLTTHDAMAFNYGKLINYYDKKDISVQTKFNYKVGFIQNLVTAKKRYNPVRNILIRYWLNKYPKKIFSISNRLKEALNQNGINNVETIHYGIDIDEWSVDDSEKREFANALGLSECKVILFGGRLSEAKGGKIMIDVLKMLVSADPTIKLLIVGTPNDYAKYLLCYSREIGVEKNIVFTGWLSRAEMKKAYSVSNLCVTPSVYFDAFNLFNIEAGASGLPVVGTCFGGTPEIVINNVTGLIVNPHNRKEFCTAILSIIKDKDYAKRLGEAGRKRVKELFSLERYVEDTLDSYLK